MRLSPNALLSVMSCDVVDAVSLEDAVDFESADSASVLNW